MKIRKDRMRSKRTMILNPNKKRLLIKVKLVKKKMMIGNGKKSMMNKTNQMKIIIQWSMIK